MMRAWILEMKGGEPKEIYRTVLYADGVEDAKDAAEEVARYLQDTKPVALVEHPADGWDVEPRDDDIIIGLTANFHEPYVTGRRYVLLRYMGQDRNGDCYGIAPYDGGKCHGYLGMHGDAAKFAEGCHVFKGAEEVTATVLGIPYKIRARLSADIDKEEME